MAGRPQERELQAKLIAHGRALGHEVTTGGENEAIYAVAHWLMDGKTVKALGTHLKVSSGLLYSWINRTEDRKNAVDEARKICAHVLVDEAGEILDSATNPSISVDRERARFKQWLASRFNRPAYGEDKAPPIAIHFGDLHIAAMERASQLGLPRQQLEPMEAEIVVEPLTDGSASD
jgi:transposase-like protein